MSVEHVRSVINHVEVSWDPADPDVLYLDRAQPVVLAPVDQNSYQLFKGRARLGDIVFHDGTEAWGWCYHPRCTRQRPSRKLHPDAMAAIRGRVRPDIVLDREEATALGNMR